MPETLIAAEPSTAPVMEVERGPLVNLTGDQRTEFRRTGELPEAPKKQEEAAASSEEKPKVEPGEATAPVTQEKPKEAKKPQTAEERIAQLEATIEKIRKGKEGKETQADSSPAKPSIPQPQATRPKPTAEDKAQDGKSKYETYEDFVEDLSDWKSEQREAKNQREQQQNAQAKQLNDKVAEARTRYENFDEVMKPTVEAIVNDADVSQVVKAMLNDSDVLPDLIFTIGSSKEELASFVKMAKENPGKALRYIALTESLIAEELEGKKGKPAEEAPVKPKTQAPKPPSEAGGRAATPPDALNAAFQSGDFRTAKAEMNRRALAKLKG